MAVSVLSVVGSQAQKHHTMVLQPILAVGRFGNPFWGLCSGSACVQINLCLLPLSPGAVSYSQVLKAFHELMYTADQAWPKQGAGID